MLAFLPITAEPQAAFPAPNAAAPLSDALASLFAALFASALLQVEPMQQPPPGQPSHEAFDSEIKPAEEEDQGLPPLARTRVVGLSRDDGKPESERGAEAPGPATSTTQEPITARENLPRPISEPRAEAHGHPRRKSAPAPSADRLRAPVDPPDSEAAIRTAPPALPTAPRPESQPVEPAPGVPAVPLTGQPPAPASKQPARQSPQRPAPIAAALPSANPEPAAPCEAFALRLESLPEAPAATPEPPASIDIPRGLDTGEAEPRRTEHPAPQQPARPKPDAEVRNPAPPEPKPERTFQPPAPLDRAEPDRRRPDPPPSPPQPSAAQPAPAPAEPQPRHAPEPRPAPAADPPARPAATRLEAADLDRRDDQTRFHLVLRDDRLGRVSLNVTERAGLIDLMVRADRPATIRVLRDSLPILVDSLAQRNLRAEPTPFAPNAGLADPRESPHERGRRERRAQEPRPRLRARRVAGGFTASQE